MGSISDRMNKFLELLETNELMLKLVFGAAVVFMGFTFLPVHWDAIGKMGVCLLFLSLGAFTIVFSLRKISGNPVFVSIKYVIYFLLALFFLMGAIFLLIFVISKLSALF